MASGKFQRASVINKISQRVLTCPNRSHKVQTVASVGDREVSLGRLQCSSANCLKESLPLPACLTESQTIASVGDRQVLTSKCQQASVDQQMSADKCLSASCLKESQPVPVCLRESQTVASVGSRQVSTGKCQNVNRQVFVSKLVKVSQPIRWRQASVDWQMSTGKCLSANCPNKSQLVPACLTESQTVASVGDR